MQWLESPLQPKGLSFDSFSKLSFSSMNKMDGNKIILKQLLQTSCPKKFSI